LARLAFAQHELATANEWLRKSLDANPANAAALTLQNEWKSASP
jgi:hypothetical protein